MPSDGIKELVVVSGKGGTGKTSVTAALALLAAPCVATDADVDAADLALILGTDSAANTPAREFMAGQCARVEPDRCRGCGTCVTLCRFGAVSLPASAAGAPTKVDATACEGCGVCASVCPVGAITMQPRRAGVWRVSESRAGPLVHARLDAGAGNSGKLVTTVRREARAVAAAWGLDLIITDGPPGVGCATIASLSGADVALVVTEPTPAGAHDLDRILDLCRHFDVPALLCVNKADLAPDLATAMEERAARRGVVLLGRLPYTPAFTRAQRQGRAVVETAGAAGEAVRALWQKMEAAGWRRRSGGTPTCGL